MRKEVKTLWGLATNPENNEKEYDMFCFLSLVLKGEIYPQELLELKEKFSLC